MIGSMSPSFFIIYAMMRSLIEFPAHSDCQIIKTYDIESKQENGKYDVDQLHNNHRIAEYSLLQVQSHFICNH